MRFCIVFMIVIYEPSARRHFSHMSALFEAQAMKERVLYLRECAKYVFAHRGLYNETNISILKLFPIVSNLVNRWRLPKCQSN
jgi:hypothetical protein